MTGTERGICAIQMQPNTHVLRSRQGHPDCGAATRPSCSKAVAGASTVSSRAERVFILENYRDCLLIFVKHLSSAFPDRYGMRQQYTERWNSFRWMLVFEDVDTFNTSCEAVPRILPYRRRTKKKTTGLSYCNGRHQTYEYFCSKGCVFNVTRIFEPTELGHCSGQGSIPDRRRDLCFRHSVALPVYGGPVGNECPWYQS
jgi:hypothetical protein